MPNDDGVDTSNNQGAGVIRLGPELQAASVRGWWHKATEGATFRDVYWPTVRERSREFRYRGPYHWLSPGSQVSAQFQNFNSYVGDLEDGESIQLDIEDPQGLSDVKVFEAIDRWSERYAGRILVYTGRFYMPYKPNPGGPVESYLIDRLMARYGEDLKWWLPWYASTYPGNKIPMTPVMWQWAGGGAGLPTSVGRIDTNEIILKDQLEKLCGYNLDNKENPVTDDEMRTIARYVWDEMVHNQQDGSDQSARDMLGWAHLEAWAASQKGSQTLAALSGTIPVVDVDAIARAVRDLLRTDPLK